MTISGLKVPNGPSPTIEARKAVLGTISQYFQPPLYWQQFEELAEGLLREVYSAVTAQQVGRPGQAQHGVDVFGRSPRFGNIGIQCKRLSDVDENGHPYPGGPITERYLIDAAMGALNFPHELNLWILATTVKRDTKMQAWVERLNQTWHADGIDRLALVWSWDDCVSYLNAFPDLKRWYYEDVVQVHAPRDLDQMILETIAMAFHRPAFEVPINCEHSDDFMQALKDTQQAMRTGELVARESRHVIRKAIGGWRSINDPEWARQLSEIDRSLRRLRSSLAQGLKSGTIRQINGLLDIPDVGMILQLERSRSSCLRRLKRLVHAAGLAWG